MDTQNHSRGPEIVSENESADENRSKVGTVLASSRQVAEDDAAKIEQIADRWELFSETIDLFRADPELSDKIESDEYEIPEGVDWSGWKDWEAALNDFAKNRDLWADVTSEKDKALEKRNEAVAALLITLFVNRESFNQIREKFSDEKYKVGWNAFLYLCGPDPGGLDMNAVDLHRGLQLGAVNLSGLSVAPIMDEFVNLEGADLSNCDCRGAFLLNANLRGANLSGANLDGTVLRGADFSSADVTGASFKGAMSYEAPPGLPDWALNQMQIYYDRY